MSAPVTAGEAHAHGPAIARRGGRGERSDARGGRYVFFLGVLFLMGVGTEAQRTVIAWHVFELTGSPLSLGVIGIAEGLPTILLAPLAGHVVDSVRRKRAAAGFLLITGGATAWLACVAGLQAFRSPLWIFGAVAVCGAARSVLVPAVYALAAELVDAAHLPTAVVYRTGTWQVAAVVGPMVAGLMLTVHPLTWAYGLDAAILVVASGLFLATRPLWRRAVEPPRSPFRSIGEAARFAVSTQVLLPAVIADVGVTILAGATALLPMFAVDVLHAGPAGLGALRSATAFGAIGMSVVAAFRFGDTRVGPRLLASLALFCAFTIVFGLSRSLPLSCVALALAGAADMNRHLLRQTLLQVVVPNRLMGRVMGLNQMFVSAARDLGAFESGAVAQLCGLQRSVVASAVLGSLVVLAVYARSASLRTLDTLTRGEA